MENRIVDLNTFADGALAERFNTELQKILENIHDPNTDASKARKLTMTVTLKADDKRDLALVSVQAKSALVPAKEIETKIVLDYDNNGQITGAELKSGVKGQTYFDDEGLYEDTGKKIVDFKQNQAGGKA